jgi:hypothetical protein
MRRLPNLAAGIAATGSLLAGLACSSSSKAPNAPVVTTSFTVAADSTLTGYVLAYASTAGSFRTWFGTQSPTVGDNDAFVNGEAYRAVVAFRLPAAPAEATLKSATMAISQCQGNGAPFGSLGNVVADHLVPTALPDSATYDTTAMAVNVATIATDSTTAVSTVPLTSSVAADYAAGDTTSMYRFRFSIEDSNNDDISDNVVFCPPTLTVTFSP